MRQPPEYQRERREMHPGGKAQMGVGQGRDDQQSDYKCSRYDGKIQSTRRFQLRMWSSSARHRSERAVSAATGGSAFPKAIGSFTENSGMTRRDYLAAHADIPWSVAAEIVYWREGKNGSAAQVIEALVILRLTYADTMIAESAK